MIDIENETSITLAEFCRLPFMKRGGRPLNIASAFRYAQLGVKGVKLETVKFPQGQRTTREAALRFLAALNSTEPAKFAPTPRAAKAAAATADRELEKAGW